jgi:hypothetical protein
MSGDGVSDIRLLLAGVDGTLVTRKKPLTDRAIEAVRDGFAHAADRFVLRTPSSASLQSMERS